MARSKTLRVWARFFGRGCSRGIWISLVRFLRNELRPGGAGGDSKKSQATRSPVPLLVQNVHSLGDAG